MKEISYFCESNIGRFLSEALTADIQAVLADKTGGVSADAAKTITSLASVFLVKCSQLKAKERRQLSGLVVAPMSSFWSKVSGWEHEREFGGWGKRITMSVLPSRIHEVLNTRLIRET